MKKIIPIFLFLFSSYTLSAQQLVVNTTRFIGGDSSCGGSEARYSIPTKDGGILFVGGTQCWDGGSDIPPNSPDTSAESTPSNVLIGKLDSNMNLSWVKVYGGNRRDIGWSAVQTADGGYAVLASTYSNNGDVSGNHGFATGDLWLVRIDSVGNLLWQKCYGSEGDEQASSIAVTPDNGFILMGVSNSSGDDVPSHYSGSEFDEDWFVVKTDSLGNKQWTKTIGGTGDEYLYGSVLAANNAYYLVSSSSSTDHDCTDTSWHHGVNTADDYYVFKLDTAGHILWSKSYGGSNYDDVYSAVLDNRDSSIVVNGYTISNDYMVTGNHGEEDMWVMKIDKNGLLKWEECLGGPNQEIGMSIAVTPFGYVVYGRTFPGSLGLTDAWLFAVDNMGVMQTNKLFGGSNYETPASIFPFRNGFAATGFTNSQFFTEGINMEYLTAPSGDAFVSYINYWPLSIPGINVNHRMVVYPNPSKGDTRIVLPVAEKGNINITNCIGENVYAEVNVTSYVDFNIANWADGIYIVRWQGEDGAVLTQKLIKV